MSGEILQSQITKPKSWISQQWSKYKSSVAYLVIFIFLFIVWHLLVTKWLHGNFVTSQIGYFVLGILHVFIFYNFLTWADKKNLKPLKEWLFTGILAILAFIVTFINFRKSNIWSDDANLNWSVIPFIIPFLIMKAWDFWEAIPERKYNSWQYPAGMEPPVIIPLGEVLVKINLQLSKNEENIQHFEKYNLDSSKSLGDHLHFLIYDFPNSPEGYVIKISDPVTNNPYNWIFTIKPFLFPQKVLDFNVPVKDLKLKTGMTINIQNR